MSHWIVNLGLIVCVLLLSIPVVMLGRLVWSIVAEYRHHRRDEMRTVSVSIPGLGEFSSADNRFWLGAVDRMQVTLETTSSPPAEADAQAARALLHRLPELAEAARHYIVAHDDIAGPGGTPGSFEPFGISLRPDGTFELEMSHPADADGIYRVEFRDGAPVSSARDD